MFFSERLNWDHDLSRFSSGKEALDVCLKKHALPANRSGTGRTYVWIDEARQVVEYFTLAPHLVREELPTGVARGSPDAIPSILPARLALDQSLHGQGWGAVLLAGALRVALEGMRKAGGRLRSSMRSTPRLSRSTNTIGSFPCQGTAADSSSRRVASRGPCPFRGPDTRPRLQPPVRRGMAICLVRSSDTTLCTPGPSTTLASGS